MKKMFKKKGQSSSPESPIQSTFTSQSRPITPSPPSSPLPIKIISSSPTHPDPSSTTTTTTSQRSLQSNNNNNNNNNNPQSQNTIIENPHATPQDILNLLSEMACGAEKQFGMLYPNLVKVPSMMFENSRLDGLDTIPEEKSQMWGMAPSFSDESDDDDDDNDDDEKQEEDAGGGGFELVLEDKKQKSHSQSSESEKMNTLELYCQPCSSNSSSSPRSKPNTKSRNVKGSSETQQPNSNTNTKQKKKFMSLSGKTKSLLNLSTMKQDKPRSKSMSALASQSQSSSSLQSSSSPDRRLSNLFHSKMHKKSSKKMKPSNSTKSTLTSSPSSKSKSRLGSLSKLTSSPSSKSKSKSKKGMWKSAKDEKTNKTYYYHTLTKEVSWERPAGFTATSTGWKSILDKKTNRHYFYNATTKETTWEQPKGFEVWKKVEKPGQRVYYYNVLTKESKWKIPNEHEHQHEYENENEKQQKDRIVSEMQTKKEISNQVENKSLSLQSKSPNDNDNINANINTMQENTTVLPSIMNPILSNNTHVPNIEDYSPSISAKSNGTGASSRNSKTSQSTATHGSKNSGAAGPSHFIIAETLSIGSQVGTNSNSNDLKPPIPPKSEPKAEPSKNLSALPFSSQSFAPDEPSKIIPSTSNQQLAKLLSTYCPDESELNNQLLSKAKGNEVIIMKGLQHLIDDTPFDELRLAIFHYVKDVLEGMGELPFDEKKANNVHDMNLNGNVNMNENKVGTKRPPVTNSTSLTKSYCLPLKTKSTSSATFTTSSSVSRAYSMSNPVVSSMTNKSNLTSSTAQVNNTSKARSGVGTGTGTGLDLARSSLRDQTNYVRISSALTTNSFEDLTETEEELASIEENDNVAKLQKYDNNVVLDMGTAKSDLDAQPSSPPLLKRDKRRESAKIEKLSKEKKSKEKAKAKKIEADKIEDDANLKNLSVEFNLQAMNDSLSVESAYAGDYDDETGVFSSPFEDEDDDDDVSDLSDSIVHVNKRQEKIDKKSHIKKVEKKKKKKKPQSSFGLLAPSQGVVDTSKGSLTDFISKVEESINDPILLPIYGATSTSNRPEWRDPSKRKNNNGSPSNSAEYVELPRINVKPELETSDRRVLSSMLSLENSSMSSWDDDTLSSNGSAFNELRKRGTNW